MVQQWWGKGKVVSMRAFTAAGKQGGEGEIMLMRLHIATGGGIALTSCTVEGTAFLYLNNVVRVGECPCGAAGVVGLSVWPGGPLGLRNWTALV